MADTTSETIFTSDTFTGPTERQFPGGTTYQEFVGQQAAAGVFSGIEQEVKENIPNQFLNIGLEGGRKDVQGTPVDLNSYFGVPLFRNDMKGLYEPAKEAYKREQDGTATPEDNALLARVRDPNGTVMKSIRNFSQGHPVLGQGFIDTGTFPKNPLTGEIEGLDIIPESALGEGYEIGPFDLVTSDRDVARRRAEDGEKLMRYVRGMPDLQRAGAIQDAVVQAVEADMFDIVAERLYNLASASEEGLRHYLPRFARWATDSVTGIDVAMSQDEIAQDLAEVRNSSFFANRQEVLNDIIRDQLMEMGFEETLRENGYLDKQEVDGVERYTKNFVSQRFAEGFFEQVFDSQSFVGKLGSLMIENVGAYAAVKAPVQGSFNAVRLVRRHIDNVRGRPSATRTAEGFEVPQKYGIMSPSEQLTVATEYAALRGIPLSEASRQLAMMNKSPRFWNKWASNSIVDRLGVEANRQAVTAAGAASIERISILKSKLINAQRRGNTSDILKFSEQLRSERAYSNWRKIKAAAPLAKSYGISPVFDSYMALAQVAGREAMGPIGEAVGAGAFLGVAGVKTVFDIKGGVPFVSSFASKMAFNAKVSIEDSLAFFLEFNGHAARGFAQGILVNPGLRGLMGAAPEELSKFLTAGQMSQLQRFSDNMFKGMTPFQREAVIGSMDQGFQDVEKVLAGFEDFVSADTLKGLRQTLSLNLGESTSLNVFLALEHSNKLQHSGLSPKDVTKFTKKLRANLDFQTDAQERVGAMTVAIEQLDRAILQIEDELSSSGRLLSADDRRAREFALDNLRALSGSFRNAEAYGKASLEKIIRSDKDAADQVMAELSLQTNEQFMQEAFLSGQIDNLLKIYARFDTAAQETPDIAPEGAKGPASTLAGETPRLTMPETTPTELREAGTKVQNALNTLRAASKNAVDRNRVSSNAEERARSQNLTVVNMVELAKSASKLEVDKAYKGINTQVQIPLNIFGSDMLTFFKSYAAEGESFIKYIDPVRFRSFAGTAGEEFIRALDTASRAGLVGAIKEILPDINRRLEGLDINFATADEYIGHIKRQIENDDSAFMLANGFRSADDISDAQLTFYLIDNPAYSAIDATALRITASPQELETLRQGTNALIKSGGNQQKQLGTLLRSEIDKAFDTWGQGANVELYNAVVVARKTHQLERQRFEKGTFGYKVDRAVGEQRVAEGTLEVGDTAKISNLIRPIAAHIANPTADSAAIVRGMMDDIMATFAPVTSTMAEQVLRLDANGRYVLPTTEEIAATTTRVMDEASFQELQIIMDVVIRNAVFDKTNMRGLREALDSGKIPALNKADAPRRIDAPAGYAENPNPLEAYFQDIQKDFVVSVRDESGNITQRTLFDMDDLVMADRDIVKVVNAVPEYRKAHSDLLSVAKTQRDALEGAAGLVEEGAEASLREIGQDLPKFASGSGFVKNVIQDSDPRAFDLFLNRIRDSQKYVALTEDQKVAGFRALFTETLKEAGGYTRGTKPVIMFDGQSVPRDNYSDPQNVFLLLDDMMSGGSDAGRKLGQLAEVAGITDDQISTLHAVFRLSTQVEAANLLARGGDNKLTQLTKGFTLDNALSKAFNIARGMVSKEYVAAEVALRYAALAQGKALNFLLQDSRAAGVVKNLLEDPTRVDVSDAEYFGTALMKFIAGDLPATVFQVDVGSDEYAEEYWISQGLLFTPEPDLFEQAVP